MRRKVWDKVLMPIDLLRDPEVFGAAQRVYLVMRVFSDRGDVCQKDAEWICRAAGILTPDGEPDRDALRKIRYRLKQKGRISRVPPDDPRSWNSSGRAVETYQLHPAQLDDEFMEAINEEAPGGVVWVRPEDVQKEKVRRVQPEDLEQVPDVILEGDESLDTLFRTAGFGCLLDGSQMETVRFWSRLFPQTVAKNSHLDAEVSLLVRGQAVLWAVSKFIVGTEIRRHGPDWRPNKGPIPYILYYAKKVGDPGRQGLAVGGDLDDIREWVEGNGDLLSAHDVLRGTETQVIRLPIRNSE